MAIGALSFLATWIVSLLLDGAVRPRRRGGRQWQGWLTHSLAIGALYGLFLAGSGNYPVAALLVLALMALLMISSNAKHAMLGEPLLFSDLALVVWVFRHPRFYLTALSPQQRWILGVGAPILMLALILSFGLRWTPHLAGGALLAASLAMLFLLIRTEFGDLAGTPDIEADVERFGLIATLIFYWALWRAIPDPDACIVSDPAHPDRPELILIVQCESFADPVDLTGDPKLALPGLERARAGAWQWGKLGVSGFGAYTMRTEYGVIFGRDESALGYRRFDPFLTALGETSYALPTRLKACGYRSLFVHPHDMRFYGRDRLMPAAGFDELIGEESFSPVRAQGARYVSDGELAASLTKLVEDAAGPTLIYAVTMENHGPWIRDPKTGSHGGLPAYLYHLGNSDTMLSGLIDTISRVGRPAMLVFFGDHRPSIPGVTKPGGDRHTPYVVMRVSGDGEFVTGKTAPVDLTPDKLHHLVLNYVLTERA